MTIAPAQNPAYNHPTETDPTPLVPRNEDRYLLEALESESVLRACLYRYTRNRADVDELLQETYARLLIAGTDPNTKIDSVRGFALRIARNTALDWLRHRQVVPLDLVADIEALNTLDTGDQVEEIVNSHQELTLLSEAIDALPEKCREVFMLRKVYGLTQKEIAARLHISENTVEQHLTKAARRCAQTLFDTPIMNRQATWVGRLRQRWKSE